MQQGWGQEGGIGDEAGSDCQQVLVVSRCAGAGWH